MLPSVEQTMEALREELEDAEVALEMKLCPECSEYADYLLPKSLTGGSRARKEGGSGIESGVKKGGAASRSAKVAPASESEMDKAEEEDEEGEEEGESEDVPYPLLPLPYPPPRRPSQRASFSASSSSSSLAVASGLANWKKKRRAANAAKNASSTSSMFYRSADEAPVAFPLG